MNYSTLTPDISALARDAMMDEPVDWNFNEGSKSDQEFQLKCEWADHEMMVQGW